MNVPRHLEADEAQLTALAQRLERRSLDAADYELLKVVIDTVCYLSRLINKKTTSIQRLLRLIFGARTEKTSTVLKDISANPTPETVGTDAAKPKRKGHGRRAAGAYWGARKVSVAHGQLKSGDVCTGCAKGKLYDTGRPAVLLRLCAQPPIAGTAFELEQLRCALCGKLYGAVAPAEAGEGKYDDNVAPMLAALRYGYGLPMNRLAQMQEDFGIPLPAGTQWELLAPCAAELRPALDELARQAAGGEVVYNDDTVARILSLEKQIRQQENDVCEGAKLRTGVFTTGILSTRENRSIALFFSGREHAGENLQKLLDRRPAGLPPPIQMCDALSRNEPATAKTILANCNSHGRRGFVEVANVFPEECTHVLETMRQIYKHDEHSKREAMSPGHRLLYHQQNSGPLMEELKQWLNQKLESKQVEPNGSLGEAMRYMLKHWEPLTLFLRQPGAPLDNNICERALKMAIRHRNNSLFYKTENGAHIGDLFMSLIHTCRLSRANPFDYLATLRRYSNRLRDNPSAWMPWNYLATTAALTGA